MLPAASSSTTAIKKRRRTAQACTVCRTKKGKCDGLHPSCTPCIRLGYRCEYVLDSSAPPSGQVFVSEDYIRVLEERIRKLEGSLETALEHGSAQRSAAQSRAGDPSPEAARTQQNQPPENDPVAALLPVTAHQGGLGLNPSLSLFPTPPAPPAPAVLSPVLSTGEAGVLNGSLLMGTPNLLQGATLGLSAPPEPEVYGALSGISFQQMLLDRLLPGFWCLSSITETAKLTSLVSSSPCTATISDLPSRAAASAMFDRFECHTWQLYPFLDMGQLRQSYEDLLSSVAAEDGRPLQVLGNQPIICLHLGVFAFVQSMVGDGLTAVGIDHVALRVLRKHTEWPHSTSKGSSWDLLGYAIRSAYAIGLHSETTNARYSRSEGEMRRRVWWSCYMFDRLVTASIGRPSAITEEPDVSLPSPLPGERPEPIQCFGDSIRLHQALAEVITRPPLSLPNESSEGIHKILTQNIYILETRYGEWYDSVQLGLESPSPLETVLALRGLTLRLLLHRPIMLALIRDYIPGGARSGNLGPSSSCKDTAARARDLLFGVSVGLVVEVAIETVRVLENGQDDALSPPWYQLFYCMNAFLSLVAALLLDLSQWIWFIRVPGLPIPQTLYTVQRIVRSINAKYDRPSAHQALEIIHHVLSAVGLAEQGTAENQATMPAVYDLPQLDFEDLCNSLGLNFES